MKRMLANVRQLIHSHELDLENQLCVGWNSGRVGVKEGTAVDANDCKHIMSTDDQMSFSHTELTSWKVRRLNSTEHKHIFTRHAPTQPKKRILVFRDTLPSIGPLWFNLQSSRFTLAHRHDGLIPLWETKDQMMTYCETETSLETQNKKKNIITHSSDDSAQASFEAQWFSLPFLSCRCRERRGQVQTRRSFKTIAIGIHDKHWMVSGGKQTRSAFSRIELFICHTCGDIGVKDSPVLQGTSVPAAHSFAFLRKVYLVTFLQYRLGVLGRTLWKAGAAEVCKCAWP